MPRRPAEDTGLRISRDVREQPRHLVDEAALVVVRQPLGELLKGHPGHLNNLDIFVGQLAALGEQQVVMNRLVDPAPLGNEPEVDRSERGYDATRNAGLLCDLANRCYLGGFAFLDVAFRQ